MNPGSWANHSSLSTQGCCADALVLVPLRASLASVGSCYYYYPTRSQHSPPPRRQVLQVASVATTQSGAGVPLGGSCPVLGLWLRLCWSWPSTCLIATIPRPLVTTSHPASTHMPEVGVPRPVPSCLITGSPRVASAPSPCLPSREQQPSNPCRSLCLCSSSAHEAASSLLV